MAVCQAADPERAQRLAGTTMRLFIAIDLPDALKDQLEAFKTDIPGAAWVKRTTFHLTLRFLSSDIDPIRVPPMVRALEQVSAPPFAVTLCGVGRFPPSAKKAARVLWVGIEPSAALTQLHQAIEQALAVVDFPPEGRAFNPHITLARLKLDKRAPEVEAFLAEHADFAAEPFTATAFHLYESKLTPQGAQYTRRGSFGLEGEKRF